MINIKYLIRLWIIVISIGEVTAQNISGIINSYAKVTDIVGNSLTIENLTGAEDDFNPGKKVLVIQMKGAEINRSNTADYGSIIDIKEAGNFEFAIVESKTGSNSLYTIVLHSLLRSYDPSAFVQVIAVPQYNEDIIVSDDIVSKPWSKIDGTGGVVALEVTGTLTLAANIDVSRQGFAGGTPNPVPASHGTDLDTFVYADGDLSGQKGEGIAIYGEEGAYAMGPLANGGGGGNNHNAGGGGGGNFSAGGSGGASFYDDDGGGGLPGKSLNFAPSLNKIFMGGGGGGGQQNDEHSSSGGAGGGIIIIRANNISTDCNATRSILANGASASNTTGNDGAGGGGAGGNILLEVNTFDLNCLIDVFTNGGNGGNVANTSQRHAGGGGGGAGAIRLLNDPGNPLINFSSKSGGAGLDCVDCEDPTGTPGESCEDETCNTDKAWHKPPNSSPIAQDDIATTTQGAPVQIAVLDNDLDPDFNDILTVSSVLVNEPKHGSLTLTDNVYTYTPREGYIGDDSFIYQICDDDANSLCSEAAVYITVHGIRLKDIEEEALTFSEGQEAIQITASIIVDKVGYKDIKSAVVNVSGNFVATEDVLSFTDTHHISGIWDAEKGTLTLTGNASLAHYQAALRSITYQNTNNDNPSDQTRTISFMVNDGELGSELVSREIQLIPVNDTPELSAIETDPLEFAEGDNATIITASIEVKDVDNDNLKSATIAMSANYWATEDLLAFTEGNGISGSWNADKGTLTLTGNASLEDYQAALRSITYQNTNNDNPSDDTRTITFTVNDGELDSEQVSREIQVIPVNDEPELSAIEATPLEFTEGDGTTIITANIEVKDVDNDNLESATIAITANYWATEDLLAFTNTPSITGSWDADKGTLTLTGNASLEDYQAALRSITYQNTNNDNPSDDTRTVTFIVNDGELDSAPVSREIQVIPVNDAPELSAIETDALEFTEGDNATIITASIEVKDVDNGNLESATIAITANYWATEDLLAFTNTPAITGSWDVASGTLTLTGNASLAQYQAALRSVTYQNTNNDNPSDQTRTVTFIVNDGELDSEQVSREIQVIPVNDAPELSAIETDPLEFTEGDNATIITTDIKVNDVDNDHLESAIIAILENYWETEDVLAFTDGNGISANWNPTTGILTLTGSASLEDYQAALRSVTYQNTNNDNPSHDTRTITFTVNDGELDSELVSREIQVIPVNDAPELSAMETAPLEFMEGDGATVITATILTKDVDNDNLKSATIAITANYWATEDVLAFTGGNGISGNWNPVTGILVLTGNASLEDYQAALRSITYQNTNNDNPSEQTRTISFTVNDGELESELVTREIQVIPVNDAPELSAIETDPLEFAEGDNATIITATILTKDVDNDNLESATIAITANYWATEDVLAFTGGNGITGNWNPTTGILTLIGNASLEDYQAALRSGTYQNTNNDNPSDQTRTVTFIVNDGELESEPVTREIQVIPVNDAPELSAIETAPLEFTEGDNATIITASILTKDVDNDNLASTTIAITANYWATEDILAFTNTSAITGSWDVASGTLTLTGSASLAQYQAALRSVTYQNTNNDNPSDQTRTVTFIVNDGKLDSDLISREIQVIPVNDAPELSAMETDSLEFTEGDNATIITASILTKDVDNDNLESATIAISGNYWATEDVLGFTDGNGITGSWDVANGTLTLTGNASLEDYQAALRSITYQNTNNDNPSDQTRTVTFMVNDGELESELVTREIQVIPVNDAPELLAIETDPLEFAEGDNATIITATILTKDVDNDNLESATIAITANYWATEDVLAFTGGNGISGNWDPVTGILALTGNASLEDYQAALRSITYQNANNDNPSDQTRTIAFIVNDGELDSDPVSREILVIPVNDAPIAHDDAATTDKNVAVVIPVLANDYDVENDELTVAALPFTPPSNGTLVLNTDNTFTYTPNFNFFGTDSFVYEVCDDGDPIECSTALVSITINYKNYSPVAKDDLVTTNEDEAIIIAVLANDTDPDEDVLTVSKKLVTKPKHGKLVLTDNKYTYTPHLNYNGYDSFEYEICDSGTPTICATASVAITIIPVNDAPEPADDYYANKDVIPEITGNVLDNDYDVEGDRLSVSLDLLTMPKNGTLSMQEDGNFSYLPHPGFFGIETFEYFACDDGIPSLCTKATVTLKISSGVPKGFSPNGDGINDEWHISGIEAYPMNTVVIFNRWGDTVFEVKGYDNASKIWRGEANKGLKTGSGDLPDGTYFYVIDFGNGKATEKGFIIIKR